MVREDFATSSAAFHDFGPMRVHAAATCCPHCEASATKVFQMGRYAASGHHAVHRGADSFISKLCGFPHGSMDRTATAFEHRVIVHGEAGVPLAVVHERFRVELLSDIPTPVRFGTFETSRPCASSAR